MLVENCMRYIVNKIQYWKEVGKVKGDGLEQWRKGIEEE